jgi:hypothetical protein
MLDKDRYIGNKPTFGNFAKQTLTPNSVTTIFNLDLVTASEESIIVVDNGVVKIPSVDFHIITSGTQIQFAVAPITGHTLFIQTLGQMLLVPTPGSFLPGSILPIDVSPDFNKSLVQRFLINSNTTALSQAIYYVDTTSGAVTLTLPATPEFGDTIVVMDLYRTFFTNNLTINRNGKNISGVASNYLETINNTIITLVFIDNTTGWYLHSTGDVPVSIGKIYYLTS